MIHFYANYIKKSKVLENKSKFMNINPHNAYEYQSRILLNIVNYDRMLMNIIHCNRSLMNILNYDGMLMKISNYGRMLMNIINCDGISYK